MCLSRNGVHIEMTFLSNFIKNIYLYSIGLLFVKYKLLFIANIRYSFIRVMTDLLLDKKLE